MESTFNKITHTVSDTVKNGVKIIEDRLLSPMYFYFIFAWVVTNWKFIYVLFFVDNQFVLENKGLMKVDYLSQMYSIEWFLPLIHSFLELFLIPIISSFIIIWWLSIISEKFFKKYEEHQMNKRVIKRDVEYREKVRYATFERKIREEEIDEVEKIIKYENNDDFNQSLDDHHQEIKIAGVSMLPSEVLYKTDYEAYKDALEDYTDHLAEIGEDLAVQAEIDRRRGK